MNEIVIARYKEQNLGWINSLLGDFDIFLYDKSGEPIEPPDLLDKCHYRKIDDIGGNEAATYIQHIIEHYDSYKKHDRNEMVNFVQAFPFDHDRDLLKRIYNNPDEFEWLSHEMLYNEWDGSPHHGQDIFVDDKVEGLHPDWLYCSIMGTRPPDYFLFGQGGQHKVKKWVILQKKKSFYNHILKLITGPYKEYKPFCAMERFWSYMYLSNAF